VIHFLKVSKKVNVFQRLCGSIRRHLKRTQGETQLKFYTVVAWLTLLYGSETWVTTKWDESRIEAAEMRFLRAIKGCSHLDRVQNEDIRNEIRITGIHEIRNKYKQNWVEHLQRMQNYRLPKQAFKCYPREKRDS
jgi:hypothetical protein